MKNYRLSDLHDQARREAVHIEAVQAALVYVGLRAAPDAGEIARAEKFEALCSLCNRASDPVIVDRLRQLAKASAAASAPVSPDMAEEDAE